MADGTPTMTRQERERAFLAAVPVIAGSARRLAGRHLSAADAEDVAQEVLLEGWAKDLDRWDPAIGALKTFVGARVPWRIGDRRKARGRRREREVPLCDLDEDQHPADTIVELIDRERALAAAPEFVRRGLAVLSQEDRRLVTAIHLHGRQQQRVAAELGIHCSNVSRANARALTQMRAALRDVVPELFMVEAPLSTHKDEHGRLTDAGKDAIAAAWRATPNAKPADIAAAFEVSAGTAGKYRPFDLSRTGAAAPSAAAEDQEAPAAAPKEQRVEADDGDGEEEGPTTESLMADIEGYQGRVLELLELVADLSGEVMRLRKATGAAS